MCATEAFVGLAINSRISKAQMASRERVRLVKYSGASPMTESLCVPIRVARRRRTWFRSYAMNSGEGSSTRGLMRVGTASINRVPIAEADRQFSGTRPPTPK